jgi:integrase
MELFEQYARENPKSVKQDTINQSRMAVGLFADSVGPRFPVSGIDKKAVRGWKTLLMTYPVKSAEIAAFKGMSLREIVKANEKLGKPIISDRTVNRYLSGLGAFCDWLVANDYLAQNPTTGTLKRLDKTKRKTLPFTSEQLNALFRSPLFTGCQSDDRMHLPGNHLIRDHRYWLPLIMLYSGARPGEIAQLLTADVRQIHGTWCIHITEEGDEAKSVKTKGSQRVVPVHPELERLGFLDYCAGMRERGERRLFPEAERNTRGQIRLQAWFTAKSSS